MRFQLDPRAQAPERPAPPPRPAASQPPAAPAPALPLRPGAGPAQAPAAPPAIPRPRAASAPAARTPKGRVRLYAILLVLLLLVTGGATGALYAMEMGPFEYPRRYMLEGGEIPRNMEMADVPADLAAETGVEENPGQVDPDDLDKFGQRGAPTPEEGWAEFLTPTTSDDPVMVMALRFADEDDARRWAGLASLGCSTIGGAILRDADVVVLVLAQTATGKAYMTRVVDALQDEAPDLQVVCRVR